jgi:hypothetical protein
MKAKTVKTKKSTGPKKTRVRNVPKHRSFKLSKRGLKQHQPIPSARRLLRQTFSTFAKHKKLFLGIGILYAVFSFVFVQGFGSTFSISSVKTEIEAVLGGTGDRFGTGVALFGYLLGSAGSSTGQASGSYQLFLTLITSLAAIWAVRQVQAGENPRLRDSFYKGVYPLIPFILVMLVIGLQMIPLLIGNLLFSTVIQNGLALTIIEKSLWLLLFICLGLLSAYMVVSSFFSLYIVTLPDMTPMKALRSARELVLHRRLSVALRIIAMPITLILLIAVITIPLIIFATSIAQIVFLLATSFSLVFIHVYMYHLYRSLL